MKLETKQLQTAVKHFYISFISMCRQFKPLVLYLFSLMLFVVSYVAVFQIS